MITDIKRQDKQQKQSKTTSINYEQKSMSSAFLKILWKIKMASDLKKLSQMTCNSSKK